MFRPSPCHAVCETLTHHWSVRWMLKRDLDEVCQIERLSFRDPWTEREIVDYLHSRIVVAKLVEPANGSGGVCGYMFYELHPEHLWLANIAVHPGARGCGAGSALVSHLFDRLGSVRRKRIECLVADFNVLGQMFFRAMGFICTGIERQPYDVEGEAENPDGYRFTLRQEWL